MYYHADKLSSMIKMYSDIECIGEILIINNCSERRVLFNSPKIREIGDGINLFVNPSWKLGVENAKYDNIILANDDIIIEGELPKLLRLSLNLLKEGIVIGPDKSCYSKYYDYSKVKFEHAITRDKFTINYGFGVFMLMKRQTFLKTPIEKEFLIWYGDHLLFLRNSAWHFKGVKIITAMAGTTSKLNLGKQRKLELKTFLNIKNDWNN